MNYFLSYYKDTSEKEFIKPHFFIDIRRDIDDPPNCGQYNTMIEVNKTIANKIFDAIKIYDYPTNREHYEYIIIGPYYEVEHTKKFLALQQIMKEYYEDIKISKLPKLNDIFDMI